MKIQRRKRLINWQGKAILVVLMLFIGIFMLSNNVSAALTTQLHNYYGFNEGGCPTQLICSLNITDGIYPAGTISANYSTVVAVGGILGAIFLFINIIRGGESLGLQ